jgi:two-component system chemotaxis response regulator CheY
VENIIDKDRSALAKSEIQFQKLIEENLLVMFLIDAISGEILAANKAASEFYGYGRQQLVGMPIERINGLTHEESFADAKSAFREECKMLRQRHRLASGEEREVEIYPSAFVFDGSHVLFCIVHDIRSRTGSYEPHANGRIGTESTASTRPSDGKKGAAIIDKEGEALKVLVVDDDYASRFLLKEVLKRHGHIDMASEGGEAVELVRIAIERRQPYRLICLEIIMAGMDGLEVLGKIRKLESSRKAKPAKVIMITAKNDFLTVKRAIERQCDHFLMKPIDKELLLNTLLRMGLIRSL